MENEVAQRGQVSTCNMEIMQKGILIPCGQLAKWKHPRYPTGLFCDHHKNTLAYFFKSDWSLIELPTVKEEV